jgi:hypothetical protein
MRCSHGFELGLGLCEKCEPSAQRQPPPTIRCKRCKRARPRAKLVNRMCAEQPCHEGQRFYERSYR